MDPKIRDAPGVLRDTIPKGVAQYASHLYEPDYREF